MASVSAVYYGLKNLANKDQKGFITPLVFNEFANIAQINIFNGMLDEEMLISKYRKARNIDAGRDKSRVKQIQEDLSSFTKTETLSGSQGLYKKPDDFSRIISAKTFGQFMLGQSTSTTIDLIFDEEKAEYILQSDLSRPTESNPVAIISSDIEVFPTSIKKIQVKYYKTPAGLDPITGIRVASTPRFGYSTVNGVEQFIPSQSVDFELPNHYIPKIIMEIGKMVGVSINEADLFQYGTAEEVKQ
jgi:hypothetical protein